LVVVLFENKGYIQKSIFTIRLVENNGGNYENLRTGKTLRDYVKFYGEKFGNVLILSNVMEDKGKLRRVLIFMVLKKENVFIEAYSVKEKMIIRIVN